MAKKQAFRDPKQRAFTAMKLRYTEIDPEVVTELPDWPPAEFQRECEGTLKELGIERQGDESFLHAWVRTMLEENGCEDTAENRRRLIEEVKQDHVALRFVWVIAGDERKAFGLDESPAFEMYRAQKMADRALMRAFAQAPDPYYHGRVCGADQLDTRASYLPQGPSQSILRRIAGFHWRDASECPCIKCVMLRGLVYVMAVVCLNLTIAFLWRIFVVAR